MAQQVNPFSFRLGVIEDWKSKWFGKNTYKNFLREDHFLRSFVVAKLKKLGLEKVCIERAENQIKIIISTSKPGLIIGREGSGIESLKNELVRKYNKIKSDKKAKTEIKLQIEEVLNAESRSQIVAQQIADQIEKRMPFRRVMKQSLEKIMQNKDVKGAKIKIAGRLDGSEMSRVEWLGKGKIPLQTLRAKIDFAMANAHCTYGVIGIKVWVYTGEVFEKKS